MQTDRRSRKLLAGFSKSKKLQIKICQWKFLLQTIWYEFCCNTLIVKLLAEKKSFCPEAAEGAMPT